MVEKCKRLIEVLCLSGLSFVAFSQPVSTYPPKNLAIAPHISTTEKAHWRLDADAWRYHSTQDVRFIVGTHRPSLASGLAVAPLGGVSFSKQEHGLLGLSPHTPWRYGFTWGKVDQKVGSHQLDYGAAVGRVWAGIELSPHLLVDGLYQQGPNYQQIGLGTQYDAEQWGLWSLNLAQSQQETNTGWRYQGQYGVKLNEQLVLRWNSETYSGSYTKLSHVKNQKVTTPQQTHGVDVRWDSGRLGILGANYANQKHRYGSNEQSLGISQQFWYSPNLRIDIDAQREKHSGDYNMGLRFSVPLF